MPEGHWMRSASMFVAFPVAHDLFSLVTLGGKAAEGWRSCSGQAARLVFAFGLRLRDNSESNRCGHRSLPGIKGYELGGA